MSTPFLAEVRIFGFNFPPRGWATCDGQILPINQNQSLFSLLGTTYGGDGRTSFALPDLRGRVPIHEGASAGGSQHNLGQKSGAETETLTVQQLPSHSHSLMASGNDATSEQPAGNVWATTEEDEYHPYDDRAAVNMNTDAVPNVGGSQSHENMQPYLVLNYCIALQGVFPSRN